MNLLSDKPHYVSVVLFLALFEGGKVATTFSEPAPPRAMP